MAGANPIAVVGAGPAGLILALLLHAHNHPVEVYEAHPQPYPLPRTIGLDSHTARILDGLGVLSPAFTHGAIRPMAADGVDIVTGKGFTVGRLETKGKSSTSGYDFIYAILQPGLESTLECICVERGIAVHRGAKALQVVDRGDYVELHIREGGGNERVVSTPFVVGCDGANSIVRQTAGIPFAELSGANSRWLVVDMLPASPDIDITNVWKYGASGRLFLDPKQPRTIIPSPSNRRRFEWMLFPHEGDEALSDASIWARLEEYHCTPATGVIERRTSYTFRGGLADTFAKGRILLAGDAAHVTPPFAGQGLNSSARDAMALAWRIDLALRHGDDVNWAKLMEDASAEQADQARRFIGPALAFERLITMTDEAEVAERDRKLEATGVKLWRDAVDLEYFSAEGMYVNDGFGGRLFLQDKVGRDGAHDHFDKQLGWGWKLVAMRDPGSLLSPETLERFEALIAGKIVSFGEGEWEDITGRYGDWFAGNGVGAALVRPDFYIYGVAKADGDVDGLVAKALTYLTS